MTTRLCRTFQTAPAAVPRENTAKYLDSGLDATGFAKPDWLVPDIEDGTAPDMKSEAVENVIDRLPETDFAGEVWPRVQWGYDSPAFREAGTEQIDTLVREVGDEIDGLVIPKVGRLPDVERVAEIVAESEATYGYPTGSVEIALIVETPGAKSDLREIAALGRGPDLEPSRDDSAAPETTPDDPEPTADDRLDRLAGLIFGPVDYTAELGGREIAGERPAWESLLVDLSNEASANDILSVGGPFDRLFGERAGVRFYNGDAYAEQVTREARVGLDGSWSLHPKQTVQANRIHTPSPEELARDVDRIERFQSARAEGTGAVTVDGTMIDEATYRNFANTVETVTSIHERAPAQPEELYDEALLARALDLDTGY
ncbi:aldolase/citrate lyase family protein [Salinirubrum litoreum]|uniref:Aldolase/citrate lyase family protein n=1 Tax=Salinirubrum litoreum TaxID=1126234 RepID=A0ABD5R9K5_9EURY|nr:aldolase/citrate lyase family protein [Salinirubrum litoreum]